MDCAISASAIRLFAAAAFSAATPRVRVALSRRDCNDPMLVRAVLTALIAESRVEMARFATPCAVTLIAVVVASSLLA